MMRVTTAESEHVEELFRLAGGSDRAALDRAIETVYADLRRLASASIRRQFGAQSDALTLQPTALVNETYFRLLKQKTDYENRQHFLAIATRLMLRVLIDYQRSRSAAKRGGGQLLLTVSGIGSGGTDTEADVASLTEAIDSLEALDARKANIVRLRSIWGFSMSEIAESLQVSLRTVERDWRFAKSWLADELR